MVSGLSILKHLLLAFWTAWFAVVALTNLFGGLKAAGRLPARWKLASTNYEAIVKATAAYAPPRWVPPLLFGGAVLWQAAAAVLFAWALAASLAGGSLRLELATVASTAAIALWAAFMLADEITLKYEFERTHELLFLSQLATLLALHGLPG